jgi:hypothetical protein
MQFGRRNVSPCPTLHRMEFAPLHQSIKRCAAQTGSYYSSASPSEYASRGTHGVSMHLSVLQRATADTARERNTPRCVTRVRKLGDTALPISGGRTDAQKGLCCVFGVRFDNLTDRLAQSVVRDALGDRWPTTEPSARGRAFLWPRPSGPRDWNRGLRGAAANWKAKKNPATEGREIVAGHIGKTMSLATITPSRFRGLGPALRS